MSHRWWKGISLSSVRGCVKKPVIVQLEQHWRYSPICYGPAGTEVVVARHLNLSCLVHCFSLPRMDCTLFYVLIKGILEIKSALVYFQKLNIIFLSGSSQFFPPTEAHHRSSEMADVSGLSLLAFLLHSHQN